MRKETVGFCSHGEKNSTLVTTFLIEKAVCNTTLYKVK